MRREPDVGLWKYGTQFPQSRGGDVEVERLQTGQFLESVTFCSAGQSESWRICDCQSFSRPRFAERGKI